MQALEGCPRRPAAGLLSDAQAATRCSESKVVGPLGRIRMPVEQPRGSLTLNFRGYRLSSIAPNQGPSPLFDVVPDGGYPAQFAANYDNNQLITLRPGRPLCHQRRWLPAAILATRASRVLSGYTSTVSR